ncbi:AI-2E family transporter [Bacillus cereus]
MNRNLLYMILRLVFVIIATVAGFYALLYMSGLIYPFIIAFAFAYLINPVVNFLNQKLQFPRALAVLVSLILVFGAIVGLVTYLVTEAISATTYLQQLVTVKFRISLHSLSSLHNHIMPLYDDLISKFNHLGNHSAIRLHKTFKT